jgi:6-phospho-3-hexuloisomerase
MTLDTFIDPLLDELRRALHSANPDDLDQARRLVLGARRIFVAGKGRSGLQMEAFAMRLMHLGLSTHVVGDVTTPGIASGDLLVIGSGSGRTASLVCHAERAHQLQVPVLLFTAAQDSPIHAFADGIVRIDAPTPKIDEDYAFQASILPMGSLFEQALGLLLDLIVLMLMRDLDVDGGQMFSRHANLE